MNDEQFELTISDLAGSGTYYADIADELRARDTAQREALKQLRTERRHDAQIQSAMAADQKAVAEALGIPPGEYSGGAGEQLLAIAKLREDLARVEADNRQLQLIVNSHANMRDTAQAQLAEALGLVREYEWQYRPYDERYHKADGYRCPDCGAYRENGHTDNCEVGSFLARHAHAQAEQQEAQGAQAGDGYFASPEEYAAQRAALATQPAALPTDPASWPLKVGADEFVSQQAEWPDTDPSDFMHDALYEMIRVLTQPAVRVDSHDQ